MPTAPATLPLPPSILLSLKTMLYVFEKCGHVWGNMHEEFTQAIVVIPPAEASPSIPFQASHCIREEEGRWCMLH